MKIIQTKKGEIAIILVLVIVMLTVLTTAAVALAISTTRDTTTLSLGEKAYAVAESGAENAILRLLRDPNYTGETDLSIGTGSATITVTGTTPKVINSIGVEGNMVRQLEVTVVIVNSQVTILNWKEI